MAVWVVLRLAPGAHGALAFPLGTLHVLQVDALSTVFALIFSLITCVGVLYALQSSATGEHVATLVYASAALGVVCAGDWLTLFACWEVMAIASVWVVWYGGTARSRAAGMRYLLVHMGGGACMLSGIMLHLAQQGSMTLHPLTAGTVPSSAAFWLILLGVGINAAIPPVHAWLPGCLPGGVGDGQCLFERVHDENGRVRAHPPLSWRRGAGVGGDAHDAVRRRVRHPRR